MSRAWILDAAADAPTAALYLLAFEHDRSPREVYDDYYALKRRRRDDAKLAARAARHKEK